MTNIYALQGEIQTIKDTEQVNFTKEGIRSYTEYAKDLAKNSREAMIFDEANKSLYKMTGINEYDKDKDEIIKEILYKSTSFDSSIDDENKILNQIVQTMNIKFDDDLNQKMENVLDQTKELNQNHSFKMN